MGKASVGLGPSGDPENTVDVQYGESELQAAGAGGADRDTGLAAGIAGVAADARAPAPRYGYDDAVDQDECIVSVPAFGSAGRDAVDLVVHKLYFLISHT